jgi:hypothetical protein
MPAAETVAQNTSRLLAAITVDELRALGIDALRRWHKQSPTSMAFDVHGEFAASFLPALGERTGISVQPRAREMFRIGQSDPGMQPLIDFLAWIVGSGLAIPLHNADPNIGGYATRYRLTSAGSLLLDADQDHPVLPGFVGRVVARCKDLPDEVAVHLADAQTCVENRLGRPAVVLAGLAYEAAEDAAIAHLEAEGKLNLRKNAKAAEKIAEVKRVIPSLFTDIESRSRADAAWGFADQLRARRNDGSHPRAFPDFSDLSEVHELLLSAGRYLPGLWSVRV